MKVQTMLDEIVELAKDKYPNLIYFAATLDEEGTVRTAHGMPTGTRNSELIGMIEIGKQAFCQRLLHTPRDCDEKKLDVLDDSDKEGSPI